MSRLNELLDKPKPTSSIVITAIFVSYLSVVGLPGNVRDQIGAWGFMLALMLGGFYGSRYILRVLRTGWLRLVLVLSCVVGSILVYGFHREGVVVVLYLWIAFMLLFIVGVALLAYLYRWIAEGFSLGK